MKKILANIGGKVAALADDIASYNDPTRHVPISKPSGPGSGAVAGQAPTLSGNVPEGPFDPVLEHLLRNVRSRHVRRHFACTPAAQYTQQRAVTIQVATFNVAGKKPPPGLKLDEWLGAGVAGGSMKRWPPGATAAAAATGTARGATTGSGSSGPDVLAVGFVEIVPLNAGNVMGVWGSSHVDAWDRCLAAYLNGEEWATQRYGPTAPAHVGQAAAAAAAATLLETKWQGGGPTATATTTTGDSTPGALSSSPRVDTNPNGSPSSGSNGNSNGNNGGGCDRFNEEYVQAASKQLVGVYLSVWVKRRLLPEVRGLQVTTVATGFRGYLGNKGAVAARMRLYDSSLVFVASHLTAGEAEGDELRRNADVYDILRRAVFTSAPDGGNAVGMTSASAALISASLGPGHWPSTPSNITDHDLVIWVGDLNYRISTVPTAGGGEARPTTVCTPEGLTDADVRVLIRAGKLEQLLAADQLNRERAAGRVFQGWHEGRLTFLPTYKFKAGSHTYNGDDLPTSASTASFSSMSTTAAASAAGDAEDGEFSAAAAAAAGAAPSSTAADMEKHKRRTPAWCDRILWWTRTTQKDGSSGAAAATATATDGATVVADLRQLSYWRGELTISDHKPVAAAFVANVVSYDRRRIVGILEAGMRAVDMMQQSLRPRVAVEPVDLKAGDWVAPGRPVPLRLKLTNMGAVEAIFHFVPPPLQDPLPSQRGHDNKFGLDDERPPLPPWLLAEPAEGVVQPGQSCELVLTVLVEGGVGGSAAQLSTSSVEKGSASSKASSSSVTPGSLDSILILRVEDSGDKFISIGGRYRRSFLGMALEDLSRLGSRPALPPTEAVRLAEQCGLTEPQQLLLQQQLQDELRMDDVGNPPAVADEDRGVDDDGTVTPPKELRNLVSELLADSGSALRVPGILADSAALVLARSGYDKAAVGVSGTPAMAATTGGGDDEEAAAAALQPTGREAQRALLRHLEPLRLVLDAGRKVPPGTNAHDVAAMLLLWCGQLPYPLIPAAVGDAAAAAPPTSPMEAAALLRRHCSALQLAVVSELLRLLRAALEPAVADLNGLTAARLAAAAAAWWMPPLAAGAATGAASGQRTLLTMLLARDAAASAAAIAALPND